MLKLNKKEVISLVKNDFIPLEESKEGMLKGGFGSVIVQSESLSATATNNCMCDGNNCLCNNGKDNCNCPNGGCNVPKGGNNCNCNTTTPSSTPSISTDPVSPTDPTPSTTPDPTFPTLTGIGFVF